MKVAAVVLQLGVCEFGVDAGRVVVLVKGW
jgi:hypothetical protein